MAENFNFFKQNKYKNVQIYQKNQGSKPATHSGMVKFLYQTQQVDNRNNCPNNNKKFLVTKISKRDKRPNNNKKFLAEQVDNRNKRPNNKKFLQHHLTTSLRDW